MSSKAQNISTVPPQYTSVTPWIISSSTLKLIEFLIGAFGATEVPNSRITNAEGVIIHAVVKIGTAMVMLFDSRDGWAPSPAFLNLYVENVEATLQRSIELGATSVTDITTLWFGEKVCRILDPLGNLWWLNERVEEVDFTNPAEVLKRASAQEAVDGIAYIQQSLDTAMKTQADFFKHATGV